jgi:hypothetical protein
MNAFDVHDIADARILELETLDPVMLNHEVAVSESKWSKRRQYTQSPTPSTVARRQA